MRSTPSYPVTSPILFSEGVSRSLCIVAEAASRFFNRSSMTSYNSTNNISTQEFISNSEVVEESIPLEGLTVKCHSLMPGCSGKFPSSKVSKSFPSHGYVGDVYNPKKNSLRLAAHHHSLPKRASLLSPRSRPASPYRHLMPSHTPYDFSDNGYTDSSLQLLKCHWEFRYEHWKNSLTGSDVSFADEDENSNADTDFNPALFPRAGSLTRPLNHPETRALIDLDWALRCWSLDKISRTLFLHDLSQRLASSDTYSTDCPDSLSRPWECDWKMKWKIIEDAMLSEYELSRYRDNTNNGFRVFDEDVVMKEIFGEDRMDVDGCFAV